MSEKFSYDEKRLQIIRENIQKSFSLSNDALFQLRVEECRDKVWLLFKDRKITYGEAGEKRDRIANALYNFGIKPRSRVAIMMPNIPEWIFAYWGIRRCGAIPVPINIAEKGEGLKYFLDYSKSQAIFIDGRFWDSYLPIKNKLQFMEREIVHLPQEERLQDLPKTAITYDELLDYPPSPPPQNFQPIPGLGLMFTSGTTGPPKGVITNNVSVPYIGFVEILEAMSATPEETIYNCLPLFHGNCLGVSMLPSIILNCKFALGERFSASKFWDEIRKYNAVEFNTLGAMIPILLKQPEKPDDKDNPVRVVLSAACPAWAWRPFEERFGVKIIEWFGMVDAPGYFINKDGKVGSMGKPCGNLEVKIVDDNDNELPSGKIGELVFRIKDLPQSETPTSYWEMPEKTYEAYGNGWFHTGDLAYKDEEGYFYFAGRKKEAIRVKGENVSAWEVENVINRHPKVLESAAIAVPSELGEDELKVIVVLREGEKMTPEELLDYCQDNMAYFKIPRYVEFRSFIPKTGTHRIRYAELKKEGITSNTWDREKAGYRIRAKEQLKEKLLKA